jgi:NADH-quinone oxidoreductase subunit C
MDLQAIHDRLKAKFGDAIAGYADVRPDPFIQVRPDAIAAVARELKEASEFQFDYLQCLSGVDYGTELGVTYHLYSYPHKHRAVVNVRLNREKPSLPTVDGVWAGANWHEREAYDMFGIVFEGSRDLRRILTSEGWVGYPLRKDYAFPDEFQGIPLK